MKGSKLMNRVVTISCLLSLLSIIADSQEWSEPVVISQNQNQKQDVDFCIDNSGTIHCVWRVVLGS